MATTTATAVEEFDKLMENHHITVKTVLMVLLPDVLDHIRSLDFISKKDIRDTSPPSKAAQALIDTVAVSSPQVKAEFLTRLKALRSDLFN
eukprot:TRINITY_DN4246_c0_g1_i1.p1 TRINITY_DN4246_c0_g1~~TRINITY_DN4246_c0_g1_i1.p1  ORF type:complete len:104 (-),score=18.44 TRINITY_DN4246_c0_g1_i1:149-421(-)